MTFNLFQDVNLDKFFEKWFDEYQSSDNFEDYVWYRMDDDVNEYESNNPDLTEKEINKWKNLKIKEKARDWFFSHMEELDEAFYDVEADDKTLIVYRTITVDNLDDFISLLKKGKFQKKYTGIGIYWAYSSNKADAHWGSFNNGHIKICLKGKVKISAIDINSTLMLNCCPSLGLDEGEIRIKEGEVLDIIDLTVLDGTLETILINIPVLKNGG